MAISRKSAILASAVALACGGAPAQAQDTIIDVELTSEMWALAGVCTQYPSYAVRGDALADFLNAAVGSGENGDALIARKNAKVAQIGANVARVQEVGSARERTERSDELTSALMTRCRRLTNDPVAREFFFTATG